MLQSGIIPRDIVVIVLKITPVLGLLVLRMASDDSLDNEFDTLRERYFSQVNFAWPLKSVSESSSREISWRFKRLAIYQTDQQDAKLTLKFDFFTQ